MKAKNYATVVDKKITEWTDATSPKKLAGNEIPLTDNEIALIRACRGDLQLAKMIIRDIEERIAKVK